MRPIFPAILACLLLLGLTGCDVPTPPPELPTPTPGSQNPENDNSRSALTPVRLAPERGFTPIAAPPGRIYFVRASRLWTVAPDGSGERQLSDALITAQPQPSPDSKLIAWIGGRDLYIMPTDGSTPRKVYTGDLIERQRIGWSSDGKLLGFFTYDMAHIGTEQAWATLIEGGSPILLTTYTGSMGDHGATYERTVQWSSDGNWAVVGWADNPMRLLRWPIAAGRTDDLREIPGGEPDWSPDSQTLLYTQTLEGAVIIYGVLEDEATPFRNEKQFVGTGMGQYGQGPGPLWSPASSGSDSDLLVYRSRSISGEPNVAVRDRGGRDFKSLPNLTNNPSWAPTGDRLVVETGAVRNDPLGLQWVPTGLSIAAISLTGDHKLTPLVKDAQWPSWGK